MSVLPWRKAQDLRITCITADRSTAMRHFRASPVDPDQTDHHRSYAKSTSAFHHPS